jgi:hypothetical protein
MTIIGTKFDANFDLGIDVGLCRFMKIECLRPIMKSILQTNLKVFILFIFRIDFSI